MRGTAKLAVLLVAGLLPGMAQAQSASCAYGARECYDGRDVTNRANRDDLANRTRPLAVTTLDITDRANRDDLANRTRILAVSAADITDRTNYDDLANRTRTLAVSTNDVTDRANYDDLTDRTRACP